MAPTFCNQFVNKCASECQNDHLSANETLWKTCMLYSLQLHNLRAPEEEAYVYFVDPYGQNSVGPPWNDTGLAACLTSLCDESSPACSRDVQLRCSARDLLSNEGHLSINMAEDCKTSICSEGLINTDIAGNGVYIAYFVQVLLMVTIICFWIPFRLAAQVSTYSSTPRTSQNITAGKSTQIPLWVEKVNTAITKIAVSFHRSQCTFALTLAITSTYLMHSNNQILGDIDQRALTSVVGDRKSVV